MVSLPFRENHSKRGGFLPFLHRVAYGERVIGQGDFQHFVRVASPCHFEGVGMFFCASLPLFTA